MRTKGIDVSKWQREIDWDQVHAQGVEFAFIRVQDGLGEVDPYFAANWRKAAVAGVVRGAYHFFRAGKPPFEQARKFVERVDAAGGFERFDLPPVLDVEELGCRGIAPSAVVHNARIWLGEVERMTGKRPILYTNPNTWTTMLGKHGNDRSFVSFPLWISHFQTTTPIVPPPWKRWYFWQYTGTGGIRGVRGALDENFFDGSLDELVTFVEESNLIPPEERDPPEVTPDTFTTEQVQEAVKILEAANVPPDAAGNYYITPRPPPPRTWFERLIAWLFSLLGGKS